MKPFRIAFVTPFYPLKGGIARFSGLLRDALGDRGYDVVPVEFKALYPQFLSKGSVEGALPAGTPIFEQSGLVLYNPLSWFGAIRYIKSVKPDILLVAYWTGLLAPFYYILGRLTSIKIVVLIHNFSSHESFCCDPFMRRLLGDFADGLVTLSNAVFHEVRVAMPDMPVLPLFHPRYEPEEVVPSRDDARSALNIDNECPVLLFFGYVRRYKGLDIMLRAMPAILQRDPSVRLVIAGQFLENPEMYKRLIKELGIGSSVDLYQGYVSSERSALFFAAADAVVLPYRSATQSGVVQLAYGYTLPVIATPVGALPEMVRHAETGWVSRDLSPEGFAMAVELFLGSRGELISMHSAIEAFRHKYSWETFSDSLGSFLEAEASRR